MILLVMLVGFGLILLDFGGLLLVLLVGLESYHENLTLV